MSKELTISAQKAQQWRQDAKKDGFVEKPTFPGASYLAEKAITLKKDDCEAYIFFKHDDQAKLSVNCRGISIAPPVPYSGKALAENTTSCQYCKTQTDNMFLICPACARKLKHVGYCA